MVKVGYNYSKTECNEKYLEDKDNEVIFIQKDGSNIPITVEQAKDIMNQLKEKVLHFQRLEIEQLKEGEVKLYRGTDINELQAIMKGNISNLSWWTTNMQDMSHYYGGVCIEIVMREDKSLEGEYIREISEMTDEYTFGSAEMACPAGSIWYSISKDYFKKNVLRIRNVVPDIEEEEED